MTVISALYYNYGFNSIQRGIILNRQADPPSDATKPFGRNSIQFILDTSLYQCRKI